MNQYALVFNACVIYKFIVKSSMIARIAIVAPRSEKKMDIEEKRRLKDYFTFEFIHGRMLDLEYLELCNVLENIWEEKLREEVK